MASLSTSSPSGDREEATQLVKRETIFFQGRIALLTDSANRGILLVKIEAQETLTHSRLSPFVGLVRGTGWKTEVTHTYAGWTPTW